jgi:septal ring factor EnvC (AmiA/AmiB activator)
VITLRLIVLSLFALALNGPAHAQVNTPGDLDALTQAEKNARAEAEALNRRRQAVNAEIAELEKSMRNLSREVKVFERDALALEKKQQDIDATVTQIETDILSDRSELLKLLAALQRLEANPPPAMVMRPDNAIEAAQAGQLIAALTQQLDQRTKILSAQLETLAQEKTRAERNQRQLIANQKQLERRRTQTRGIVQNKSKLRASIDTQRAEKQATAKRLAQEAATLRELVEKLEAEALRVKPRVKPKKGSSGGRVIPPPLPSNLGDFAKAKGQLSLPVTGPLLKRFGRGEKGLTFETTSEGQVLAPYAGRVEFAGPFKNYDQVIILAVGDGYFLLMTGLGDIFAETGEVIKQGAPVGAMPFARQGKTELYLELRKNGGTINPAPWLSL